MTSRRCRRCSRRPRRRERFGRRCSVRPADDLARVMAELRDACRSPPPIADDPAASSIARTHVMGNERLTPEAQADIYRRQFWLRHVDSMLEDYPALAHLLGEDAFDAFARAYLVAHPPDRPS